MRISAINNIWGNLKKKKKERTRDYNEYTEYVE